MCIRDRNIALDSLSVRLDADSIFSFTFSAASKPLSNTASKAVFEVTSFINTDLALFLIEQGCYQVSLGDTIGCGPPFDALKLFELVSKNVNIENIAAHFHDTYGQALSNIYAVLQMGVQTLDTSIAGLGGCPYAKGATGNVATEDVLYMLNGIGIKTGIKLEKIIEVSWYISNYMKRLPNSRVARAYVNQS